MERRRSAVPRSRAQVLKMYLRSPRLRNQLLLALWVAACLAGCLLLGIVVLIDTAYPILPFPLGFLRPILSAVSVLILACLVYGLFFERLWIETTHTRIRTAKLPPGADPIRIVHLSDFHCTHYDVLERKLPGLVHGLCPDLILMTGDYLGTLKGLPTLKRLSSSFRSPYGIFAVLGNHDVWNAPHLDLFEGSGVVLLENEIKEISIRGVSVSLIGIAVEEEEKGLSVLRAHSGDTLNILLYHYPELIERVSSKRVDLMLAGHTHGGQVALPFFGAIVTLDKGWKRYERGFYRVGESALYVNRGIGSHGGIFPPLRFFSRPEIAVLDLIPENASAEHRSKTPLNQRESSSPPSP